MSENTRQRYDHELLGISFAHNAEQATVPTPGPQNIVTPCHGMPLTIYTAETGGNGYATWKEVSEIVCSAEGCYNEWNPDGTVSHWQEAQ